MKQFMYQSSVHTSNRRATFLPAHSTQIIVSSSAKRQPLESGASWKKSLRTAFPSSVGDHAVKKPFPRYHNRNNSPPTIIVAVTWKHPRRRPACHGWASGRPRRSPSSLCQRPWCAAPRASGAASCCTSVRLPLVKEAGPGFRPPTGHHKIVYYFYVWFMVAYM